MAELCSCLCHPGAHRGDARSSVACSTGFAAPIGAAMGSAAPLISMKMKGMVGDGAPLGFFDPLGFSKDATPEKMKMCVSAPARIILRLARRRPRSERGLPCFRTRRLWPSEPSSSSRNSVADCLHAHPAGAGTARPS